MKTCTYCGRENEEDAAHCIECGTTFTASPSPPILSPTAAEERRFWEQMTFKDFGILIVKVQALWVLFPVVVELTYLPGYFDTFFPARSFDLLPPEMKQTFYMALLRIVLRVAVGVTVFVYADALLSWIARGLISRRSAEPSAAPNGGPAKPLHNSSVAEGPPSVS